MATKKTTTKKTVKKAGPGRPRKNVIGGRKATSGPGRPRKNVILTKEERLKNAAAKKANAKKTVSKKTTKKKPTAKKTTAKKVNNKKTVTKKTVTKKTNSKKPNNKKNIAKKTPPTRVFTAHKINKAAGKNNFAMRLLICSFLLFSFSVYKAFFTDNAITNPNNTIQNEIINNPEIAETVTIESYEDIMGTETNDKTTDNNTIDNTDGINVTTVPEVIITPHVFTRAFDKDESNDEIKILQKFLYMKMLYTGGFEGINDAQTREAIYAFQLKHNIITPQDPINLRGYFGPGTRAKLNAMMPKQ